MCGTPGYAMRAIVARCPLERLLFGTDAGLRPEPVQRYARLRILQLDELGLDADQREAILERQPETTARRMIDVHTHVPTHRDEVPPDELVVNSAWRPDRAVTATTTWADYEEAFADIDVSIAFTIARDRTRVDSGLNDAVAEFVAAAPGRRIGFLSIHPEVDGAEDELERARTDLGLTGDQARPELPGVRSARPSGAARLRAGRASRPADPLPPGRLACA